MIPDDVLTDDFHTATNGLRGVDTPEAGALLDLTHAWVQKTRDPGLPPVEQGWATGPAGVLVTEDDHRFDGVVLSWEQWLEPRPSPAMLIRGLTPESTDVEIQAILGEPLVVNPYEFTYVTSDGVEVVIFFSPDTEQFRSLAIRRQAPYLRDLLLAREKRRGTEAVPRLTIIEVFDEHGILMLVDPRFIPDIPTDDVAETMTHLEKLARDQHAVVWSTGTRAYGEWTLQIVTAPTPDPAFRELSATIEVTQGVLAVMSHEDLTQEGGDPWFSRYLLPDGLYDVTIRQLFDPAKVDGNPPTGVFDIVIRPGTITPPRLRDLFRRR